MAELVHGLAAVGSPLQRECQVEDLAGVDLLRLDQVDQLARKRRTGAGRPCRWTRACLTAREGLDLRYKPYTPLGIATADLAGRHGAG
jgi:hypothetical protein